ncbi:hypothetical protein CAAN1_02S01420 [[Candida] anglica]|uniref:Uncharacterized protein n=1 Tax=[Candida] anglica TaxID=148631 RepID=A0ABP0E9L0_9ASCO
MTGLKARLVSVGREISHSSSVQSESDRNTKEIINDHKIKEYPPSHPNFNRSGISDHDYIESLKFENRELQATISKQESWIESLIQQLKSNNITPEYEKLISSKRLSRRPSKLTKNDEIRLPFLNDSSSQPSVQSSISSSSQSSLVLPASQLDPKAKKVGPVLDSKGGVCLSPAIASAASVLAASIENEENKSTSPSSDSYPDIPERSSRRRRNSSAVRIEHPTARFQEKVERERLEKERLDQKRKEREVKNKELVKPDIQPTVPNGKLSSNEQDKVLDVQEKENKEDLARRERERIEREEFEQQVLNQELFEKRQLELAMEEEKKKVAKEESDRLEKERIQREEQELLAMELLERENLKIEQEQERLRKLHREQVNRAQNESIDKEKLEKERLEKERLEKERLEKERLEKEQLEQERLEKEQLEKERLEKERLEKERLEKERLEKEQLEKERLEKEQLEKERLEKEQLEKERLEKERFEKEQFEKERLEKEQLEKERLKEEQLQKEKAEADRIARERIEREQQLDYEREAKEQQESLARAEKELELMAEAEQKKIEASKKANISLSPRKNYLADVSDNRSSLYSEENAPSITSDNSDYKANEKGSQIMNHDKNRSNGSFNSYKSRIRLPSSMNSTPQMNNNNMNNNINVKSLSLDVPPSELSNENKLRSPATCTRDDQIDLSSVNTGATTPLISQSESFFKERGGQREPFTPEGFQTRIISGDKVDDLRSITSPVHSSFNSSYLSPRVDASHKNVGNHDTHSIDSINTRPRVSTNTFQVSPAVAAAKEDDTALFIQPDEFQTINITVTSTLHISSNKKSDEPQCTIAVTDRASEKEMWRIRKTYSQLVSFDNEIRPIVEYFGLPPLPEKSMFYSSSPIKIDSRRLQLQDYFNTLFLMPHIPQMVLYRVCRYLSLDFVSPLDDFKSGARKEGYLIRRYKGLGTSWKIRWCQVDGPTMDIFELPGGPMIEQIKLVGAQIGRQSADSVAEEKGYRHAFLLMESSKSSKLQSSLPKHFFCAEDDIERDEWIQCLVDYDNSDSPLDANTSYDYDVDTTVVLSTPNNHQHSFEEESSKANAYSTSTIGSPVSLYQNGSTATLDQDSSKSVLIDDFQKDHKEKEREKKHKKRSIFPFRTKTSSNEADSDILQYPNVAHATTSTHPESSMQMYLDSMNLDSDLSKTIFGRGIDAAYNLSSHDYHGRSIPSICFRCLDFLTRAGAVYEEGIFRLSGSASNIRHLKELFNVNFDVDLFNCGVQSDIHTVAGLFKTYLRELPEPILGTGAFNDLKSIAHKLDSDKGALAIAFRDYLNDPTHIDRIHYDLCYVIFKFLKEIISNNASNRMNLRNLCIVFVPTLNVSLEILSAFLVDFDCIFENGQPVPNNTREVLDLYIPNF